MRVTTHLALAATLISLASWLPTPSVVRGGRETSSLVREGYDHEHIELSCTLHETFSPCTSSKSLLTNQSSSTAMTATSDVSDDIYLTCSTSGAVRSCSVPEDVVVSPTKPGHFTVSYTTGSDGGSGQVTVTGYGLYTPQATISISAVQNQVAIEPHYAQYAYAKATTRSEAFTVFNVGDTSRTFNLSGTCTGSLTSCSVDSSSVTLPGGGWRVVHLRYTTGASGTSGVLQLKATSSSNSLLVDSGRVAVGSPGYLNASTDVDNNDSQLANRCEYSCFAAVTSQSTVPYYSLDKSRSITLSYRSDRTAPRPFVYADVSLASGHPSVQQEWLQAQVNWGAGWTTATFVNGEDTLHFSPIDTQTARLAGQIDASSYATGMYPMKVIVTIQYPSSSEQYVDSSQKLLVVNQQHSPYGRGWTIASLQHAYVQSDSSLLLTDGHGSAEYFASCGNGCFRSPWGDFTRLSTVVIGGSTLYRRQYSDSTVVLFNTVGQMTAQIKPGVNDTTSFTYDGSGRLLTVSDPFRMKPSSGCASCHAVIAFTYGSPSGTIKIQEPGPDGGDTGGRVTVLSLGSDSTLEGIQDPDSVSTFYGYNAGKLLSTIIDRRGDSTRFVYDSVFLTLDSVVSPRIGIDDGAGGVEWATPTWTFQPWLTRPVPRAATRSTPFTPVLAANDTTVLSDPMGNSTTETVDRWGQPTRITDAAGGTTTISRWGTLPAVVSSPTGAVDSTRYNASGLVVWHRPMSRDSTSSAYGSGFGVPDSIWGAHQVPQHLFLDSRGNLIRVRYAGDNADTVAHHRDSRGRDTLIVDAMGNKTSYYYDAAFGNLDSTVTPGNRYTVRHFDGVGRDSIDGQSGTAPVVAIWDKLNRPSITFTVGTADTVRYGYDSIYLRRIQDAKGQVFRWSVDAVGLADTIFDPADTLAKYTVHRFNRDGQVTRSVNQRGQAITFAYDALGRLSARGGTGVVADSFAYSSNRRISVGWNANSRDSTFLASSGWTDSVVTRRGSLRFRMLHVPTTQLQIDSVDIASSGLIGTWHGVRYFWDTDRGVDTTIRLGGDTVSLGYDYDNQLDSVYWGGPNVTQTILRYNEWRTVTESYFSDSAVNQAFKRLYGTDSVGRLTSIATLDTATLVIDSVPQHFSLTQTSLGYDREQRLDTVFTGYGALLRSQLRVGAVRHARADGGSGE